MTMASNPGQTGELLLSVENVDVGYGHVGVLEGVSLSVRRGSIAALVGRNGAGKSTLLRAISGLLTPSRGRIVFNGRTISRDKPHVIVGAGLLHVAEGRRLFRAQSVDDNLELGVYGLKLDAADYRRRLARVHELFPVLEEKRGLPAGALSGGQQQMLAIGQAMMREPVLLMLDEPSLGLSPLLVDQVFAAIMALQQAGTTILLVEQLVERALEIASEAWVLQNGRMIASGPAAQISASDELRAAYMAAR
ncbi:ABC transporter ATP-binding protein [Camelimonas fluminis]|uniref:ABC transporter ATP-binding protein n=1 Tax=Camelimonas fluminis TaxID=1576911 RepID=A0ABV7UN19_9HYPH|nr:ABC transporter ATP-binding protein [Camelimonas fluminis]